MTSASPPQLTPSSAWTWSGMGALRASDLAEVTCYLTRPAADCFALIYYAGAPEGTLRSNNNPGPFWPARAPPETCNGDQADALRCSYSVGLRGYGLESSVCSRSDNETPVMSIYSNDPFSLAGR